MLLGLATAMAICSAVEPILEWLESKVPELDSGTVWPMLAATAATGLAGGVLFAVGRRPESGSLDRREATLTVGLAWLCASLFGALPYVFVHGIPIFDAIFEAASGFTTTGATIVADIEGTLSSPVVLWRSVTQWLGGMGIVVLFVAIFPSLGVGGKHMFRSEVPGPTADGLQPRIADTSAILWRLYGGFTVLLVAVLTVAGMPLWDAINHAMTAMSTGGFSPKNASIGHYDSVTIELILASFMLFAGVNFALYYNALRGRSLRGFLRSMEFRTYFGLVVVGVVVLTLVIWPQPHTDLFTALRKAVFMVATTLTSTGYGTDDYMAYPGIGLGIVLLFMFIGGSAGSTAGGIKVSRIVILLELAWVQLRKTFRPQVVQVVRMGHDVVDDAVVLDVAAFFVVFMAALGLGTLLVSWTDGVGIATAFGANLTCLSNMGPAPFHGDAGDHFATYSPTAKAVFSTSMVLGRLELFTLLALLLPDFWRR